MTEPMSGVSLATARLQAIQAKLAAFAEPAPVTAPVSGETFAAALEAAGVDAVAVPTGRGAAGGPVSSAWTIPWLAGSEPSAPSLHVARALRPWASGIEGAGRTGLVGADGAAAVDDPLAVVSPVRGRLTQAFGATDSRFSSPRTVDGVHYAHFHDGIDLAAPLGRPVRAMAAGEVEFAGRYPDGAQVVRIRHADGSVALYAHLARGLDVRKGDHVAAGQQLGVVGLTGHTTGPHLHLELTVRGEPVDPQRVLERGRLLGAKDGSIDTSVLGATGGNGPAASALQAFDAVARDIPFAAEIRAAAVRAGIDPLLLASLVKAESSFHPSSVSYAGAMGLTQLMPATAKAMGVDDPFDPRQNLNAGARYFAGKLRRYGRVDLALAAYQAGSGAVARAGGVPDSPTTRHYIARILRSWAGYQEAAAA